MTGTGGQQVINPNSASRCQCQPQVLGVVAQVLTQELADLDLSYLVHSSIHSSPPLRLKEPMPLGGDGRRTSQIRLDLHDDPGLAGGGPVSMKQLLQIGQQESVAAGKVADAVIQRVEG